MFCHWLPTWWFNKLCFVTASKQQYIIQSCLVFLLVVQFSKELPFSNTKQRTHWIAIFKLAACPINIIYKPAFDHFLYTFLLATIFRYHRKILNNRREQRINQLVLIQGLHNLWIKSRFINCTHLMANLNNIKSRFWLLSVDVLFIQISQTYSSSF